MTTPRKREAQPAMLAVGHCWAQQDFIQGGPLGTVVFALAAMRTATRFRVRVIYDSYFLGNFRPGALFGHLRSTSLLRRARCNRLGLRHFQWCWIFLITPRMGEAETALLAAGHPWAQQEVFQGAALSAVIFRVAAGRTEAQSTLRRIRAGDLALDFRLVVLFRHFGSPFLFRRRGYSRHCLPRFYGAR